MKPADIILWSAGILLVLMGAFVVSLFIPARETRTRTGGSFPITSITSTNLWGQPLFMNRWTNLSPADQSVLIESGPMKGSFPHGQWTKTHMTGGTTHGTEVVWYLEGREVTREEWERRK